MYRPRMVLALGNSASAAHHSRFFRRHGWEVHLVADGAEFQRQVELFGPSVLVLEAALLDASARLFWNEWLADQGGLRVVLVVPERNPAAQSLQEILQASALVTEDEPIEKLAEAVFGHRLAEAV